MTDYEIIVLGVRHNIHGETTDAQAIAFARAVRRVALEEAACMLEAESDEAQEWGYERFARYTKEAAMKVRALSQQDPQ